MSFVGLAMAFFGFLIAFASLGITQSTGGRLGMVLAGIVVTLIGIVGVMVPAYQKTWIWKK